MFPKQPTPDPSLVWHFFGSERPSLFVVCSTGTRRVGQAIFGTRTRHSTPGHMPNLRAAGRLMPVARAPDGLPLCLLGKRLRIALNPEPRQFLRFFDFEAETIETRSVRRAAALASATGAVRIGEARLRTRYPAACCRATKVRLDPMRGDRDIGVTRTRARASNSLGHDDQLPLWIRWLAHLPRNSDTWLTVVVG